GEVTLQLQDQAIDKMKKSGVTVRPLSAEERKEWAGKVVNLPKERYDEVKKAGQPAEAIYVYIDLLEKAGYKFPRDWKAER
ncbi:MAG: hypothetical protein ACM3N5_03155, partial [Candidatus Eiseniibacteriota bacterium]